MTRSRMIAIAVALAVLIGGGSAFLYFDHRPGKAAADPSRSTTLRSPDGRTTLTVPKGAMAPGAKVRFENGDAKKAADVAKKTLALKSAGTPVNINATSGSLAPGKIQVTMHYDPSLIPAGLTDRQVGLAVFDEHFDTWVPILNAKVDPKTQSVTGLGPHFSWFDTYVLDPAKKVIHVAGQVIKTTIDASITVNEWFNGVINDLTVELVKDLFGVADGLECKPSDLSTDVTTKSALNRLSGCTQSTGSADIKLRLRNGFAFPMLLDEVPEQLRIKMDDVWENGSDLTNLLRNLYWVTQGRMVLSGAELGSITVTPDMKSKVTAHMNIDDSAVAFDAVIAFLMVIAPEAAGAKAAIKSGMESALKGVVSVGELGKAESLVREAYDAMDCVVGELHAKPSAANEVFKSAGMQTSADVAHSCLSKILGTAHLEGALFELLSTLKVIPEIIEATIYHKVDDFTKIIGNFEITPPSATVTYNPFGSFAGTWTVHGAQLVIRRNGTGDLTWNGGPCSNSDDLEQDLASPLCEGHSQVTFTLTGNGRLQGTYGPVSFTSNDTGESMPPPPGDWPSGGQTFYLRHYENDTNLLVSSNGTGTRPGNPYFCSLYAENHNDSTYQLCGA